MEPVKDWREQSWDRCTRLFAFVSSVSLAGVVFCLLMMAVTASRAQAATWTLQSIEPPTGFTDPGRAFGADPCAGFDAWVQGWGGVVVSCSATPDTLTGAARFLQGTPEQVAGWTYVYARDGNTPPPDAVEFSWSNQSHLMQGMFVLALCGALVSGIRSGNHL